MTPEKVVTVISRAFNHVTLGDGVGLWEAQGMDDYEDVDVLKEYRSRDERRDWRRVKRDTLDQCESSLHYLNANGMRFYLPAFLVAEVQGDFDWGLLFHVTNVSCRGQGRFTTLDDAQKGAVKVFLKWCLHQDKYKENKKNIKDAIKMIWS